jgi:hypothetical protein
MAEDIRRDDPRTSDLTSAHSALVSECAEQSRNTLYTSTSFYIWLRWLKSFRAFLWVMAVICASAAASAAIAEKEGLGIFVAGLALLGVILPAAIKALKLDDTILAYEVSAAKFKKAESDLGRAARVWSHKEYEEFESEARRAFSDLEKARECSLTPPEWCFRSAQKKVQSGDYDPDSI